MGAFELALQRKVITEEDVTEDILKGFLGGYGRAFYGVEGGSPEKIVLRKDGAVIAESVKGNGVEVVPFRRGTSTWSAEWK